MVRFRRAAFAAVLIPVFFNVALVVRSSAHAATPEPATSAEAIAQLNAYRLANGIPGGIVEYGPMSQGCAEHVGYMAQNGITHDQDPARAGATALGAAAGTSSVLTTGNVGPITAWSDAPYHWYQVLEPSLAVTGFARGDGGACLVTLPKKFARVTATDWQSTIQPLISAAPVADATYAWPGDGTVDVEPRISTCGEGPTSPAVDAGLSCEATAPSLMVWIYRSGVAQHATSVTLVGSTGVAQGVRHTSLYHMDAWTPDAPLAPGTRYTATATAQDGTTKSWSFTTARATATLELIAQRSPRGLTNDDATLLGRGDTYQTRISVMVEGTSSPGSGIADAMKRVTAVATRAGEAPVAGAAVPGTGVDAQSWSFPIRTSGTWRVCASLGGGHDPQFVAEDTCEDVRIVVDVDAPRLSGIRARRLGKPIRGLQLVRVTGRLTDAQLAMGVRCTVSAVRGRKAAGCGVVRRRAFAATMRVPVRSKAARFTLVDAAGNMTAQLTARIGA